MDQGHSSAAASTADAEGQEADVAALAALDASLRLIVNGSRLPHSDVFRLPAAVPCSGGCRQEVYCSAACNEVQKYAVVL